MRTLGQMVKEKLYRQNLTQKHIHTTHKKSKRGKNNISCSQSPPPEFGLIRCLFRYSTNAGTSSCLWSFNPLFLRLLGEISLSLLCSHNSRVSALDLDPPLPVGHLRASVLRSDRMGLKEQLIRGLWLTQAQGREGYRCGASLRWAAAGVTLQQPEVHRALSQGSCPWTRDAGSGGLRRFPGGAVWIVTFACTQASWWRQQQP